MTLASSLVRNQMGQQKGEMIRTLDQTTEKNEGEV